MAKNVKKNSPIIIIGMHRSGTTMLTKLLEKLGLFVGDKKRKNYEATFFQKINKYLLYQGNTTWDFPKNMQFVDSDYLQTVSSVVAKRLKSPFSIEYLGLINYLKYRSVPNFGMPWAWKDPVNSLTIDVWKNLFPEAKIIYVYRNPIDVAQSLKVREAARRKNRNLSFKQKWKQLLLRRDYQFNQSYLIQNLELGVDLWKSYIELNEETAKRYPQDVIKVKYEDLLDNPEKELAEISKLCGLCPDEESIKEASLMIDSSRKYGFLKSAELCNYYEKIKADPLLQRLGYGDLKDD